jgi:hypothetical protein
VRSEALQALDVVEGRQRRRERGRGVLLIAFKEAVASRRQERVHRELRRPALAAVERLTYCRLEFASIARVVDDQVGHGPQMNLLRRELLPEGKHDRRGHAAALCNGTTSWLRIALPSCSARRGGTALPT